MTKPLEKLLTWLHKHEDIPPQIVYAELKGFNREYVRQLYQRLVKLGHLTYHRKRGQQKGVYQWK
jgi:hypothetical protein